MINETTNYKIKKPTPDEYYDIALNNENADIIDGAIKINADAIATKQAIITGGASTIASANLPVKKAVVTDSTGKITVADVTDLELGYVKGVTGALQTQINTKASASGLNSHTGDAVAHITAGERSAWNALPTDANFTAHVTDSVKHITGTERTAWNAKTDDTALNSHKSDSVHIQTGERTKWNNKTDDTTVDAHVLDTGRHVTAGDKTNWNSKTDNTALNSHKGDSTHITGAERILWTGKTDDTVVNSHAGNGDIHVTKALKAGWTAKADVSDITGAVSTHAGLNTHITEDERTAWNALPTDANFTAHVTDSVKHITGTERTAWNAKETPSGAQSKATTALTDAKSYVDGKVKTDVPVGAIFTDNNTVTSINGKTGVIAKADIVALGIPAQDTVVNISGKVDVEAGKGLSTNDYTTVEKNKLAGLSNYTHPSTHPASIITESTTKRFVTDAEKTAWNAKTTDANLIIHEADAVKHITSSERATWNNKVNISTGGVHKNKFVQTDADGNIKKFDTIQSADVPVHSAGLLTSGTIPSGRIGLDIGRASDLTTHAGLSTHISSTERTKWNTHIADSVIHVTSGDKTNWMAGYTHISDAVKHITAGERTKWDTHIADSVIHVTSGDKSNWNARTTDATVNAHIGNATPHASSTEKTNWNAGYTHISDNVKHITANERTGWNAKANDNEVVKLNGVQTINDIKTFSEEIKLTNGKGMSTKSLKAGNFSSTVHGEVLSTPMAVWSSDLQSFYYEQVMANVGGRATAYVIQNKNGQTGSISLNINDAGQTWFNVPTPPVNAGGLEATNAQWVNNAIQSAIQNTWGGSY